LLPDEKINASDCVTQFIAGQGFLQSQQSTLIQTRRRKPARRTERTDRRAKIPSSVDAAILCPDGGGLMRRIAAVPPVRPRPFHRDTS
jgi:hypothetical protein